MKTVWNPHHAEHSAKHEFFRGKLVPAFETPARADGVLAALHADPLGPVVDPVDHGLAPIARVHAVSYLSFLQSAWAEWAALHVASGSADPVPEAFPAVWPVRTLRDDVVPTNFAARMGLYSMDSGTPLTAGSWNAAYWGAQATLTALDGLLHGGERSAYVLTRPPGHHAGADFFGGYCFINNVAVAAQAARDAGLARVAILDVDYHHGNGTQAIFYDRADVFVANLHGDPRTEYPFFLGHADECGAGAGRGFNANFPLPAGSDNPAWFAALDAALARLQAFGPQLLVVSLGVDTFVGDPISHFKLDKPEYIALGQRLARFASHVGAPGQPLPTLFVQEGGYATAEMGHNVHRVLSGFMRRA